MVVVLVIGSVLLGAVLVSFRFSRPKNEAFLDHQRVLGALRDAERSRSPTPAETRPTHGGTDHVHILDEPPAGRAGPRKRPRPSTRRHPTGRRRNAAEIAERPTIASLPTTGYVPMARFPAAADEPARVEPVPATMGPGDHEPEELLSAEPGPPRPPAWQAIAANLRRWHRPTTRVASVLGVLVLALAAAVVVGVDHGAPSRITVQRPPSRPRPVPPRASTTQAPQTTSTIAHLVATVAGNATVTVVVPFTVTLAPTGTCWVSVRADNGQTLFEGTLHAGQRQQVAGSGPLVIRLGNTSAMSLMLNGTQLDLSGVARTANVQFVTT